MYRVIIACLFLFTAPFASPVHSFADDEGTDQSLSPYFLIKSEGTALEQFPLKSTSAEVNITGVIADVAVKQVYQNTGQATIEAIYMFPASTRAAVYGMTMKIGERVIRAKIKEKQEAKKIYTEAKKAGKSASLLQQHRPNVFQMKVANILPGDLIEVELRYTELLIPEDSIYEFIYPTVVGPRYSNLTESQAEAVPDERWVQNPYLTEGEPPANTFDIRVNLAGGMKLKEVSCGTHRTDIAYDGPDFATIKLAASESQGGNRDYILRYRLAGDAIESGIMLFEGKEENFFLAMIEPPKRITAKAIPPREYIFIVDVSGSMHGFPLNISKKLLRDLVRNLTPNDRFNVLLFAGGTRLFAPHSLAATPDNADAAIKHIENQRGGGGTQLLPALKRALALPRDENFARSVVIVTDGYVRVEQEAFEYIRKNLGNANFFSFGIGSSVNRFIIEGMARAGSGEPLIITRPEEAPKKAEKFREYIQSPVLSAINLTYYDFDVYDVEPLSVPDVLAERPVTVFGKWRGKPRGSVALTGTGGEGVYSKTFELQHYPPRKEFSALRYLWARERIRVLSDFNQLNHSLDRKLQITNLGLTYNLLTKYTSFVAVDEIVRRKEGKAIPVKQPLPLPKGVSNLAVGGSVPTVPEPEMIALLAVLTLLGFSTLLWRRVRWSV